MTKQRLREALNKADHIALDGDMKYYDFVNLFEAIKPQITNDDQKEMERLIRSKDYEKLDTYMSGIAARGDNKNQNKLTANVVGEELIEDNDELTLDEIWEEELREGRNDLQPKKCKALLSGNTYYAPYDKKEKMFAQYGSRFRYETEEACWDAINDPNNDLGYEKGGKSDSLVKQHKEEKKKEKEATNEALLTEGEIVDGPFEVKILWDTHKHAFRASANDGIHGTLWCQFPKDLRIEGAVYKVSKLNYLGSHYGIPRNYILGRIDSKVTEPEKPTAKSVEKTSEKSDVTRDNSFKVDLSFFEALNNSDSDIILSFGKKRIPVNNINPETLKMILKPIKKSGELFSEAIALVRLYDNIYNRSEGELITNSVRFRNFTTLGRGIHREDLLRESGSPSYARAGDHSTWFDDFRDLDLAILNDNYVYAGSNLKNWVEGKCPVFYIDDSGNPIKDPKNKKYGIYRTSGNPEGIDLTPYTKKSYAVRADQGMQPGRSHGKGDTKIYGSSKSVDDEEDEFNPSFEPFESDDKPKANSYTVDLSFFESLEDDDLHAAADRLERESIETKKKIYRDYANLALDEEITEDNLQDWTFKHMCCMHGWPFEQTRKELLGIK